jgi:hypothetical protein
VFRLGQTTDAFSQFVLGTGYSALPYGSCCPLLLPWQADRVRARLASLSPLIKCLTQRLTVLTSAVRSPYTLFRCLWIPVGLTSLAVRNLITTPLHTCICNIGHFNCLCFVHMRHPTATPSRETRDFKCSVSFL